MNERIKELAEQAGYLPDMFGIGHWDMPECIKFAELVRQDEREACAEHYLGIMRDAVAQAVKREREVCAKLCEQYQFDYAAAIRGRTE